MSIPVPQNTYIIQSLLAAGTGMLSVGDNQVFLAPGERATVTVFVGSVMETTILAMVAKGQLSQVSVTAVFTAMSGYSQVILPVITDDQRIVGVLTLDSATAFTGAETSVVVSTKTIAIRRIQYLRLGVSPVNVDFMAASMNLTQEAAGIQWNMPTFQEVSGMTAQDSWKMTGVNIISPGYSAQNQLQQLLTQSSY